MQKVPATSVDSQQLLQTLLQTANMSDDEQKSMMDKYEEAVFSRTMRTLLALLPGDQRRKLETTMHFQPDFFLNRVMAILQAFASADQIVEVLEKTSMETFMEFFDELLVTCNQNQKRKIQKCLNNIR